MAEAIIHAEGISVFKSGRHLFNELSFIVEKGKCLAITGPSGSGKTTLLQVLAGMQHYSGKLTVSPHAITTYAGQQHRFLNRSNTASFYYQQRFNSFDAEDAQTAEEAYPQLFSEDEQAQGLQNIFGLKAVQHQSLLHLSNGENKRLQLAKALLQMPDVLLLDAPFTGLDTTARALLEDSLSAISKSGTTVILTCAPNRIPACASHVLSLHAEGVSAICDAASFQSITIQEQTTIPDTALLKTLLPQYAGSSFVYAVQLKNINIHYGNKQVLQDVSWEVRQGERWLLSGPNGAGKSTLLSLITADNPQAYANEIYLFDRKRGSGESIWDVKKNIGYVSPEMHLYFDAATSVFDAVASGFFDTIGLFRILSDAQTERIIQWLQLLQITHQKAKLLRQLPLGQQRLVLLARALIKCPPLLVLDEPLQGLDETQSAMFIYLLETLCAHTGQTLIYVSHYTDEVPACITNHLRLEGGKVM